jgi:hypothetical protein
MKFDPKKPHGIVIGMDGCAYEQDGKLYALDGSPFVEPIEEELDLVAQSKTPTKTGGGKNVAS